MVNIKPDPVTGSYIAKLAFTVFIDHTLKIDPLVKARAYEVLSVIMAHGTPEEVQQLETLYKTCKARQTDAETKIAP